jgi:hypothetical protein
MLTLQGRNGLDGKNFTQYRIWKGKMSDIDLLWDIQRKIEGNTICPLVMQRHGRWQQQ